MGCLGKQSPVSGCNEHSEAQGLAALPAAGKGGYWSPSSQGLIGPSSLLGAQWPPYSQGTLGPRVPTLGHQHLVLTGEGPGEWGWDSWLSSKRQGWGGSAGFQNHPPSYKMA